MAADPVLPVLSIENLQVRYRTGDDELLAVAGLSLAIRKGESFGLVGESGCGKSSVAMAIMRHLGPRGRIAGGRVLFRGTDLAGLPEAELRRLRGKRIAMIYQDAMAALNPSMRIGNQLAEVLQELGGLDAPAIRARVLAMLESVGIADPAGTAGRYPHQVSGGQAQRAVIAMAFLAEPDLLLLDEPTTALDVSVEAQVMTLLEEMRSTRGTTVLFISHNLGLVRRMCDTVGVMYAGQIVERGPASLILAAASHPYARGLLACLPRLDAGRGEYRLNSIPGQVPRLHAMPSTCSFADRCADAVPGRCDRPQAMEWIAPRHAVRCVRWDEVRQAAAAAPPPEPGPLQTSVSPVLALRDVGKTYDIAGPLGIGTAARVRANDGISLDLRQGETLGIVGESGSGKSTLARIVIGLELPSGGHITLLGDDVTAAGIAARSAGQVSAVQMVFQNPDSTLNPSHTVGFILDRAVHKLGRAGNAAARRREVERLLDLVRLPREAMRMRAARLSGGQKQRVAVARAFAGRPKLVVADEPTSALDTSVKTAVLELLLSVQREAGTAMIFISHDLALIRYVADRVVVMHRGRIVESGPTAQVFANPTDAYWAGLLAAVRAYGVGSVISEGIR